jgi:RHS repeat-associated protein
VLTARDGGHHQTSFSYEPSGFQNVASVTKDGKTTQFVYDAFGRSATVTNALGQVSSMGYDLLNRPTTASAPGRGTSSWSYDESNRTYTFTDGAQQQYRTTVNSLGAPVAEQSPASALTDTYRYDDDGNLSAVTTRANHTRQVLRDLFGRDTLVTADGVGPTRISHDPEHQWTAYENGESIDTAFVDGAGRVTKQVSVRSGTSYTITSTYGEDGDRQSLSVVSPVWGGTARTLYFDVDSVGRRNYVGDFIGGATTVSYNSDGQPDTITVPTGPGPAQYRLRESFGYAGNDRVSTIGVNIGVPALEWAFNYDVLDRVALRQRGVAGNADQRSLEYDAGGRLSHWRDAHIEPGEAVWNCPYPYNDDWCAAYYPPVETTVREETYTYDAVGNRTGAGVSTLAGNRLVSFTGYTMTYDADGNLLTKSGNGRSQSFTWNGLGQLTQVVTDGVATTFGYDGLGRRVRKATGGVVTWFLYDGANMVMQLDGGTGQPQLEFSYYPGVDDPHAVRSSVTGAVYYYLSAPPGHVMALVNQNGQVVNQYEYAPFGAELSTTEQVVQPFRFAGRELDAETGLYYNRARYYDPALARFISEDPIGLAGGVNQYVYGANDPVNLRDPSGLDPECVSWWTSGGEVKVGLGGGSHTEEGYWSTFCWSSGGSGRTGGPGPRVGPAIGGGSAPAAAPSNPTIEGAKVVGRKVLACSEELSDFALAASGTASFHAAASLGVSLGKQWLVANMKILMEQGVNRAVENRALNYGTRATLQIATAAGGLGGSAAMGYVDASAAMRGGVLNADFVLGALPYVGAAYTGGKAALCLYNK